MALTSRFMRGGGVLIRSAAAGMAALLAVGGCGSADRIEPVGGSDAELGPVVMRASSMYPEGPRTSVIVRTPADDPDAEGVRHVRTETATAEGGGFEVLVRREGTDGDEGLIRRVWLRRLGDGSVVMERVQDSEREERGGPPWRAFVYDPPLLLAPAALRAGEVVEAESALSERTIEAFDVERHRGVISRRLWAPMEGDPSIAVAREFALGLIDEAAAGGGVLLLETLRVEHRGAVMRREHVWVVDDERGGRGGGFVGSAERFRLSVFGVPVQSGSAVERRERD